MYSYSKFVFGYVIVYVMYICKSERVYLLVIIFLDNNIVNNDIVMMMIKVMIIKRNERMEFKS